MSGCAQKRGGSGTKVRVTRSELALSGESQLSPKPGCGDKLIHQLFGRVSATGATTSVFLVRHNTVGHRKSCLGVGYHVETGDPISQWHTRMIGKRGHVLGGHVLVVRSCMSVCGAG